MKTIHAIAVALLLQAFPKTKEADLPKALVSRADDAALDMGHAFARLGISDEERAQLAPAVFVWSFYESGWQANPKGSNDLGAACGVMQVHEPWKAVKGATCEAVRADRVLGYEVGITVLRSYVSKCGSLRGGLTAFSTNGSCPKKGWAIQLVVNRCRIAGC